MNKKYSTFKLIKSLAIVLLVGFLSKEVAAQNEPMYSQYMFNMMATNPAYTGSRGAIGLNYFSRAQWSGISGAPTTNAFSIDGSTLNGRFGLGVQMYNDKIDIFSNNIVKFMFATRVKVSDEGVLSGGIQLGLKNSQINPLNVENVYDKTDNIFYQVRNDWDPVMGAGVFYNTQRFYAGFSIPNILRSTNRNINQVSERHLFLATGYVFDISDDIKLKPSTLIKMSSGAPVELDVNANVWFKNTFGIGAALRTGDAYVGMAEVQVTRQLRIGYAYDYTLSDLRTIVGSTNEVMFRYEFRKDSKNVKSTRYF
jgi:type IX secretion system PorP/SprF family membrane protein